MKKPTLLISINGYIRALPLSQKARMSGMKSGNLVEAYNKNRKKTKARRWLCVLTKIFQKLSGSKLQNTKGLILIIQARKKVTKETKAAQSSAKKQQKARAIEPILKQYGIEMVKVPGGSFDMGDRFGNGDDSEKPLHRVKVNDFYMSKHPVTYAQYDAFCEATGNRKPEEAGWGRGSYPIVWINWYEAVEFCNWLSKQAGLELCYTIDKKHEDPNNTDEYAKIKWTVHCDFSKNGFRLPTEAEWEYAARGSPLARIESKYKYAGKRDEKAESGNSNNSGGQIHLFEKEMSQKSVPYNMRSNIFEWCWDWYDRDYYKYSPLDNPKGPDKGSKRVTRGLDWIHYVTYMEVHDRYKFAPSSNDVLLGFRLFRSA